MARAFGWILLAVILVGGAWWLMSLPGTVGAQIGDTAIQLPTPVFLLALLVLFLAVYLLFRLIGTLLRSPHHMGRRRLRVNRRDGDRAVTRTLIALAAGDGAGARRGAVSSRQLLGDTPQTLLLAAYAGRLSGDTVEADSAFQALAARPDASFLGLRGLLQQATAREDWPAATELARQAEAAAPGAPWLRAERAQLAIRNRSWKEAMQLSGPDAPVGAFATAAAMEEPIGSEGRRVAKKAWEADPALPPAALAYARQLRAANKESTAQSVLRTTWAKTPHPEIAAFALAAATDDRVRLRQANNLASAAPDLPESSLLLAQVATEAGLKGEARRHVQQAQQMGMNQPRLWRLMAAMALRSNNIVGQAEALRRAAMADPDPVWRCSNCNTVHQVWHPVCDVCHAPGRIAWTTSVQPAAPVLKQLSQQPLTSDGVIS